MVRLRHLCLWRHLHFGGHLPWGHRERNPVGAHDICGLVPCQTPWWTGVGTARRPDRASFGARGHDPVDVRRNPVRRPRPVLRHDRVLGTGADGCAPHDPGFLHRRGIRWRRHLHGRVRAMPQARLLRQLPRVRHAGRLLARCAADARVLVGAQRRSDEYLGLAAALPGCRPTRPGRCLSAVAPRGHADLPGAGGAR